MVYLVYSIVHPVSQVSQVVYLQYVRVSTNQFGALLFLFFVLFTATCCWYLIQEGIVVILCTISERFIRMKKKYAAYGYSVEVPPSPPPFTETEKELASSAASAARSSTGQTRVIQSYSNYKPTSFPAAVATGSLSTSSLSATEDKPILVHGLQVSMPVKNNSTFEIVVDQRDNEDDDLGKVNSSTGSSCSSNNCRRNNKKVQDRFPDHPGSALVQVQVPVPDSSSAAAKESGRSSYPKKEVASSASSSSSSSSSSYDSAVLSNGIATVNTTVYTPAVTSGVEPIRIDDDTIEQFFEGMVMEGPADRDKPLVVLDCANIGWEYGVNSFSVQGVLLAMKYFSTKDVIIRGFLPAKYMRAKPTDGTRGNAMMETEQLDILKQLASRSSILAVVPGGDSDDAYIINYAREHNGFVISNDLFRDHISRSYVESTRNSIQLWLRESRCGYTFMNDRLVINPLSVLRSVLKPRHSSSSSDNGEVDLDNTDDEMRADGEGALSSSSLAGHEHIFNPQQQQQQQVAGAGGARAVINEPSRKAMAQGAVLEALDTAIAINSLGSTAALGQSHSGNNSSDHSDNSEATCSQGCVLGNHALKHSLLARSHCYLHMSLLNESLADAQYILSHIDSECGEARQILLHIQKMQYES